MMDALDDQVRNGAGGLRRSGAAGYGRPEDIASVVAFLTSNEAAHVNGAAWVVDAGMTVP
jgi:NAD(P)-dependent dehydrogenase (short-subunit alcohol dehydrogenase family)